MSIFTYLYFLFIVISFSSVFQAPAEIIKQLQAQFTCSGELSVYTGQLHVSNNQANMSSNFTLHPGTEVLAVRCRNYKRQPWIMGNISNGMVTDTRWKCFSLPKDDILNGLKWAKPDFNDSHWPQAIAGFANRGDSPWGKIPDISDAALWISTADKDDRRLFCRRNLSDDADVPLKHVEEVSRGIFQAKLDGVDYAFHSKRLSEVEVSDVMQCFRKCRDDSQCLSFNFEYTSVLPTKKCELNGFTKGQDPKSYVKRPGYMYFESEGQAMNDMNGMSTLRLND